MGGEGSGRTPKPRYDYKVHWKDSTYEGGILPEKWAELVRGCLIPGSTVDLGCGNGRFTHLFDPKDYLGVDISEKVIEIAQNRYPEHKFIVADIVYWGYKGGTRFDNCLAWTTLQHIPPDFIEETVKRMKLWCKNFVICAVTDINMPMAEHCFVHDYSKWFKIVNRHTIAGGVELLHCI